MVRGPCWTSGGGSILDVFPGIPGERAERPASLGGAGTASSVPLDPAIEASGSIQEEKAFDVWRKRQSAGDARGGFF